jgi:osmotically-inducible protein OsmY
MGDETMNVQFIDNMPAAAGRLAQAAMERLRNNPYKVLSRVSCESDRGVLYLRGRLFSHHEKQVAQKAVAAIKGVTRVVNEIEVY